MQPIPETARVINPEYREIDSRIKKAHAKLARLLAEFGSKTLKGIGQPKEVETYEIQMAELQEQITLEQNALSELKQKRKQTPKHITFELLPENERFSKLATDKKKFIDTIKMIAYRAETALANIIRPQMARKDEARSVVRQIFNTEVNLKPDEQNKLLVIELHNLANEYSDQLAQIICDALNDTEITFPGSDMKIFYKMVSDKNRRDQEV